MVVSFVIGIHQSLYYGVAMSYWLFMLSTLAFLWLNKRLKEKKILGENEEESKPMAKNPKRKKK
jgi:hypothetical protein